MNHEQQLAHDALHSLVTRTCYGEILEHIGRYAKTLRLAFDEEPCTYAEALEHIGGGGRVIVATTRGPKGGWGRLTFIETVRYLPPPSRHRRFHLVREVRS